nr:alpha/beta hydrolase [Allomuricauda sp.]
MTEFPSNTLIFGEYLIAETKFGNVRYAQIGPVDGEVVLFSTGGGAGFGSVHSFEWLANSGFRVISINRPGYFDLPIHAAENFEEHAEIYHEVIHSLGIKGSIHVFGVSMGGVSALYYAKKFPTKSLVLWSAITGKYKVNKESANSALGRLVLSKRGKRIVSLMLLISARFFPKKTIRSFLKTEANLSAKEERKIAEQVVNNPNSKHEFILFIKSMTPMEALYEGMMNEVKLATELNDVDWTTINCPTLVVHSTVDIDVSIEHAERLKKMIRDCTIKYVVAGGHFVWWGNEGEMVKKTTQNFLMEKAGIKNK